METRFDVEEKLTLMNVKYYVTQPIPANFASAVGQGRTVNPFNSNNVAPERILPGLFPELERYFKLTTTTPAQYVNSESTELAEGLISKKYEFPLMVLKPGQTSVESSPANQAEELIPWQFAMQTKPLCASPLQLVNWKVATTSQEEPLQVIPLATHLTADISLTNQLVAQIQTEKEKNAQLEVELIALSRLRPTSALKRKQTEPPTERSLKLAKSEDDLAKGEKNVSNKYLTFFPPSYRYTLPPNTSQQLRFSKWPNEWVKVGDVVTVKAFNTKFVNGERVYTDRWIEMRKQPIANNKNALFSPGSNKKLEKPETTSTKTQTKRVRKNR